MLKVTNQSRSILLASRVSEARNLFARMQGLLGKTQLGLGEGLWISPCTSIHTFFMKMSIDAVFLNGNGLVVGLYHSMPPFRLSKIVPSAIGVLELASGALQESQTAMGDTLIMETL